MWTLILTISLLSSQTGAAIDHIDGFKSVEKCLEAGNMWIKNQKGYVASVSAVCVEK